MKFYQNGIEIIFLGVFFYIKSEKKLSFKNILSQNIFLAKNSFS